MAETSGQQSGGEGGGGSSPLAFIGEIAGYKGDIKKAETALLLASMPKFNDWFNRDQESIYPKILGGIAIIVIILILAIVLVVLFKK